MFDEFQRIATTNNVIRFEYVKFYKMIYDNIKTHFTNCNVLCVIDKSYIFNDMNATVNTELKHAVNRFFKTTLNTENANNFKKFL